MKKEQVVVFTTVDGKRFFEEDKAIQHEKTLTNTRAYKVRYSPDLTETGQLFKEGFLLVQANGGNDLWAEDWLYNEFGNRVAFVQGVSPTENWTFKRVEIESVDHSKILAHIIK